MKHDDNILHSGAGRPYEVPEGYFDRLRTSLYLIPQRQEAAVAEPVPVRPRRRAPIFAMAACGIAALCVAAGVFFMRRPQVETLSYEQMLVADLIPHTGLDYSSYYSEEPASEESLNQEDLYDWLTAGGASVNTMDYETDY